MTTPTIEDTIPSELLRSIVRLDAPDRSGGISTSWGARSERGTARRRNEDAWTRPGDRCWVVADGMGGRAGGDVAADACVEALGRLLFDVDAVDWRSTISAAHDAVRARTARDVMGPSGVAVAAAVRRGQRITVAHAGDVRVYRIRRGDVALLTRDHNVASDLQAAGVDPETSAFSGRELGALTCFLGGDSSWTGFEVRSFDLHDGDVIVMCTDGVHRHLRAPDWSRLMDTAESPGDVCDAALTTALERGSVDDATVMAVRFGVES